METGKSWFAIYTKAKWEKKVSNLLCKRKIENFCPLNKVVKQWADRKKTLHQPLFSCYVFVYISPEEVLLVKQTVGVLNFVHWLGKPAVIRDEEIDTLKKFLSLYEEVNVERINVNIHDTVKIIKGAFISKEGNVIEVRKNSVKVLLPTLGYALVAEVQKSSLEVINIFPQQVIETISANAN